jgi:hypothetical protein
MHSIRVRPVATSLSAFAGFQFPPEVIILAVRWYLRFGLSYRDVEELLAERGVEVDHVRPWVLPEQHRPRWSPTGRRCTRSCSTSCFRPSGTTASSTATTGSKPTTAS